MQNQEQQTGKPINMLCNNDVGVLVLSVFDESLGAEFPDRSNRLSYTESILIQLCKLLHSKK